MTHIHTHTHLPSTSSLSFMYLRSFRMAVAKPSSRMASERYLRASPRQHASTTSIHYVVEKAY
jgi:hypothetical protein